VCVLAASLSENLGYGLLVLCDSRADFQDLPEEAPGTRNGRPFISSEDATVVSVQHGSDGDVQARLWTAEDDWGRHGACELGVTSISLPSGVVVICDVLQDTAVRLAVEPGTYRLQINADEPMNAAIIDFVMVAFPTAVAAREDLALHAVPPKDVVGINRPTTLRPAEVGWAGPAQVRRLAT
jgi:hypothetical protein